ncbi:MAG: dihydrodipicolinate synthase family protein [Candidatus Hinthialibacter antarcticus]|nr:dihydrodipicolinate synthase family protein [Candidatus Hinthialibacter antarcticus]
MTYPYMRGAYPALVTPFTENGSAVALDKLGAMVERHVQKGVSGLFICGTTGQGPNLTADEKIAVVREVVSAAAGRFEVWAQVTCDDWPGTLKTIDAALKTDVTGLSFLQPWYYGVDVEAQYQFHARAAERVEGKPVYLYNIPQCAGNNIEVDTVKRLLDSFEVIRGIKESASPAAVRRWLDLQCERFHATCGVDTVVAEMLRLGIEANVTSFGNAVPDYFVNIHNAARKADWTLATEWQQKLNRLVDAWDSSVLIPKLLEAYCIFGVETGCVRPPLRELSDAERANVKEWIEKEGLQ